MAETRPVYFGLIHDSRLRRGAPMVCVDPRLSATAAKADRWIQIRPGTDLALALGMIHHVVSRGRQARPFLAECVVGAERLERFVLDKGYTPEWASGITDIPADQIKQIADELAGAERAVIFGGKGLNQHVNGLQTNRAFQMLCILLGHWGRPGAGFIWSMRPRMRPRVRWGHSSGPGVCCISGSPRCSSSASRHVVTTLLFAGYVAGGGPIYWWHLRR